MPNPYLYAVIGLVVVIVVVGAILGMQVSSLSARVASLESQYSSLMSNYTALQGKYSQLSTNYTQLQSSYSQLQQQYAGLENQYSSLQGQYEALNQTYTDLVQNMTYYKPLITPILYTWNVNDTFALWLNITNPTSQPTNVTISEIYSTKINEFIYYSPYTVYIPPHTTIGVPLLFALYDPSYEYIMLGGGGGFSGSYVTATAGSMINSTLITAILNSGLEKYGIIGTVYNITISNTYLGSLNSFGYMWYYPSTSLINLLFMNPLSNSITISGYSVYSYNGSLLTSCTMTPPITVNATGGIQLFDLYTESYSISMYFTTFSLASEGFIYPSITLSLTCTSNYVFPANVAQLPYGYVVLSTNVGNITVPLIQGSW